MAASTAETAPTSNFKYINKLKDSLVLILGATSGIGFGAAEASLEYGATVLLSSSSPSNLSSASTRLKTSYPSSSSLVHTHPCDLSRAEDIEKNLTSLLEFAVTLQPSTSIPSSSTSTSRKIDHIIFTAGDTPSYPPLASYTATSTRTPMTIIRHEAALILGKLAPTYLTPGSNSSITFSGGSSSFKPPKQMAYLAGNASYLEGMTRGLAVQLAPARVNLVALGAVDTELLRRFVGEGVEWEEVREGMGKGTLLGKVGRVEDVVEGYLYFMRDGFVTGQTVVTDGGRVLV